MLCYCSFPFKVPKCLSSLSHHFILCLSSVDCLTFSLLCLPDQIFILMFSPCDFLIPTNCNLLQMLVTLNRTISRVHLHYKTNRCQKTVQPDWSLLEVVFIRKKLSVPVSGKVINPLITHEGVDWTNPLIYEDPDMDNWRIQPSIVMGGGAKTFGTYKTHNAMTFYNAVLHNAQVDFRCMNL